VKKNKKSYVRGRPEAEAGGRRPPVGPATSVAVSVLPRSPLEISASFRQSGKGGVDGR
jgi:hypothetical protein